ncbi:MAG TPA: hypothetical protein VIT91_04700 [Chthoniobacterales bacterium]
MFSPRPVLVVACVLFAGFLEMSTVRAQTNVDKLYSEAQHALMAGDVETASSKFREILTLSPRHEGATSYLKMMAVNQQGRKSQLSRDLDSVVLEKVTFRNASLSSVLEYLKVQAGKVSAGKVIPSFVLKLPQRYADEHSVTLDISNIPFKETLRYIGELTGTKFEVQEYAIVVSEVKT